MASCERGLDGRALTRVVRHLLKKLRDTLGRSDFADERALVARIDRLLESEPDLVLDDRDVWAKAALESSVRYLARDFGPQGVRVNAIAPGYMATDNTAPLRADEKRDGSRAQVQHAERQR